jgi:exopolyphosphatase/guanosine-5'-triphosphate,3'-diphosphate pyrophosphatase
LPSPPPRGIIGYVKRIAAIDLGTNSVRLAVADILPDHSISLVREAKEVVRLGEGAAQYLQEAPVRRAEIACRGLSDLARQLGAELIVAVATSAVREARNRDDVLARLQGATGVDFHVISGTEEGRLIHLGVVHNEDVPPGRIAVMDIGGGSLEVTCGDASGAETVESVRAGAIRVAEAFPGDARGRYDKKRLAELRDFCRNTTLRAAQHLCGKAIARVYGTSGTIENLWEMTRGASTGPDRTMLSLDDLTTLIRRMAKLTNAERAALPRINPERADIIVAGAVVIEQTMLNLGVPALHYSNRTLRDGLLLDIVLRSEGAEDAYGTVPVRERSVLNMLRRFRAEEAHGRQTARLAVSIFDQAASLGWHRYGTEARELLRYASLLHDVGVVVGPSGHHKHGHYLVTNAPLAGFHKEETDIIGALVMFHRKAWPRTAHPIYTSLPPKDQALVADLLPVLRLADALDRSHGNLVTGIGLSEGRRGEAELTLNARGPVPYEEWAVHRLTQTIPRLLGHRIVLVRPE